MKLLVINGANLNMLGIREPDIYGAKTYKDLVEMINLYAKNNDIEIEIYQSNHEGDLVDKIQEAYFRSFDGIVINPGGYTHTSVAILDALKAVKIKYVEVHISDVSKRDSFRQISYIREGASKTIMGKGLDGYIEALDYLKDLISNEN
jgi:3-dehydroquinate dehydratase-2